MSQGTSPLVVAIDGPAGAGKTTVARRLAAELAMTLLDTGAIYRALALAAQRRGIAWEDEVALAALASGLALAFAPANAPGEPQRVLLDGEDVTAEIRTPSMSDGASRVSVHPAVRGALLDVQRAIPARSARGCVAEGRDMGTVVFPAARVKFFLTASPLDRARRRHAELSLAPGDAAPTLEEVARDMVERDERDSRRAVAPLRAAADAVVLDTGGLDVEQVLDIVRRATLAVLPER